MKTQAKNPVELRRIDRIYTNELVKLNEPFSGDFNYTVNMALYKGLGGMQGMSALNGKGTVKLRGKTVKGVQTKFSRDLKAGDYIVPYSEERLTKLHGAAGSPYGVRMYPCRIKSVISDILLFMESNCLHFPDFKGNYLIAKEKELPVEQTNRLGSLLIPESKESHRVQTIIHPFFTKLSNSAVKFKITKTIQSSDSKLVLRGKTENNSSFSLIIHSKEGIFIVGKETKVYLATEFFPLVADFQLIFHSNCIYVGSFDDFDFTVKAASCLDSPVASVNISVKESNNVLLSDMENKPITEEINKIIVFKKREGLSSNSYYVEHLEGGDICDEGRKEKTIVKYKCDLGGSKEMKVGF